MKKSTYLILAGGMLLMVIYGLYDPAKYAFPPCPFRWLTGWLCPGCGSQRAIHHALHGNFGESFRLNSLFLPAIAYALMGLLSAKLYPTQWPVIRSRFFGLAAAYVAVVIIIVFWIGRNIF